MQMKAMLYRQRRSRNAQRMHKITQLALGAVATRKEAGSQGQSTISQARSAAIKHNLFPVS